MSFLAIRNCKITSKRKWPEKLGLHNNYRTLIVGLDQFVWFWFLIDQLTVAHLMPWTCKILKFQKNSENQILLKIWLKLQIFDHRGPARFGKTQKKWVLLKIWLKFDIFDHPGSATCELCQNTEIWVALKLWDWDFWPPQTCKIIWNSFGWVKLHSRVYFLPDAGFSCCYHVTTCCTHSRTRPYRFTQKICAMKLYDLSSQ